MQRRLDPETGVNKPFEDVSWQGHIQNFFQGGSTNFRHFLKRVFFSAELILSNLSTKNDSMGSGGMLPQRNFENLHTEMAILVVFEQFLRKVCHFFAPNFECFSNDAFSLRSFDYACLRRLKHIVMKRFEMMKKFCSTKTLLKMAGGGMHKQHIPHPPLDPPLVV